MKECRMNGTCNYQVKDMDEARDKQIKKLFSLVDGLTKRMAMIDLKAGDKKEPEKSVSDLNLFEQDLIADKIYALMKEIHTKTGRSFSEINNYLEKTFFEGGAR